MGLLSGLFGKKTTSPTGEERRTGLRKVIHNLGGHGIEKTVRPLAKPLLPVVGSLAGGLFGGPMGAIMGGSLGGALSSKKHPLDHALGGALVGVGNAFLGPKIGSAFGIKPESMLGGALNMQHPALTEQVYNLMGPAATTATSAVGRGAQKQQENTQRQSLLSQLGPKGLIDTALLATYIGGSLGARSKMPHQPSIAEIMESRRPNWRPEDMPRRVKAAQRRYIQPPPNYDPTLHGEHIFFEEVNPPLEYEQGYRRGGYVDGHSGGQQDNVPMEIPEGSYVMDATTVSLLGDGNSKNGARRLKELENRFLKTGIVRNLEPNQNVRVRVSDGEYILNKNTVSKIGKGSNKKGVQTLNKMRENLREQKGVKKFLPPKSKQISKYMR